jgi:hypothetical protein
MLACGYNAGSLGMHEKGGARRGMWSLPAGLHNLTAIGANAGGDVESAPVAIDTSVAGITANASLGVQFGS